MIYLMYRYFKFFLYSKGKGIPITGHGVPQGMRMQGSTYSQPRHLELQL